MYQDVVSLVLCGLPLMTSAVEFSDPRSAYRHRITFIVCSVCLPKLMLEIAINGIFTS